MDGKLDFDFGAVPFSDKKYKGDIFIIYVCFILKVYGNLEGARTLYIYVINNFSACPRPLPPINHQN